MNREIKFRAWDKELKMMDYDFYIHSSGKQYQFATRNYDTPHIEIEPCVLILMQYTNLKDKNGIEVYEGDILLNRNGETGYVAYLPQEAGFVVVLKNRDYRIGHRNTGEGYDCLYNHIIVGNIYKNPELLQEDN